MHGAYSLLITYSSDFLSISYNKFCMLKYLPTATDDLNDEWIKQHGYTAMHQAAQQGHVNIIDFLLQQNASPNAVTNVSRHKVT